MPISMICQACALRLRLKDELAGKKVRCPKCEALLRVPGAARLVPAVSPDPGARPPAQPPALGQRTLRPWLVGIAVVAFMAVAALAVSGLAVLLLYLNRSPSTTMAATHSTSSTLPTTDTDTGKKPTPVPIDKQDPALNGVKPAEKEPPSPEDRSRDLTRQAAAAVDRKDLDGALDLLNQALQLNPRNAEAAFQRGRAHAIKGDDTRALADYNQAIRLDPKHAEAYNARGLVHDARGDRDQALDDFSQAIEFNSRLAKALNNRGNLYANQGKFKDALKDFSAAVEADPSFGEAHNNRGMVYYQMKEFVQAVREFDEAIRMSPSAVAHNNRGFVKFQQGKLDEAVADYDEALRLDPKFAAALHNRGLVHLDRAAYDRAIEDITRAIALQPTNALFHENRAACYDKAGDRARADADRALAKKYGAKATSPEKPVAKGSAPRLANLEILATEFSPPKIKFTVQIDLGDKAEIDEMWATVGVPEGYKVSEIVAGRLRQGLLSIRTPDFEFDLAKPSPSSKLQRCSLKKKEGTANVWEGEVRFPKVQLEDVPTPFSVLLADTNGKKSNPIEVRVNLKTGKTVVENGKKEKE